MDAEHGSHGGEGPQGCGGRVETTTDILADHEYQS